MKRGLLVLASLAAFLTPHFASAMNVQRSRIGGIVEGLTLGDVDGDARLETAVLLRNGTWSSPDEAAGSLVMLNSEGSFLWEKTTGANLAGHPTMADFDGDGHLEVAFCELADEGRCLLLDGDGSTLWASPALYYPAMSGVAPGAADLNRDGAMDLVTTSWGGTVLALDGKTGQEMWRYEAFEQLGEVLYSNPTLVDLSGDGIEDVVAMGSNNGYVFALDGKTGAELWRSLPLQTEFGNYSRGNSAMATQLVPGGKKEILVTMGGSPSSALVAFTATGSILWRSEVPGNLNYMSAVAADINGDQTREIFIQSGNGLLFEVSREGKLLRSVSVGTSSWVPPAFVDIDSDGVVEILAASVDSLTILKGQDLVEVDHYAHVASGIQPSPVVADRNRDGQVEFLVGSWYGNDLLQSSIASASWYRWETIGGSAKHQGEHPIGAQAGGGLVSQLATARDVIKTTAEDKHQEKAARQLESSLTAILRGDPWRSLRSLGQALSRLQRSAGDTQSGQAQVAHLAVDIARQTVDRTLVLVGPHALGSALSLLDSAQASIAEGNFERAVQAAERALLQTFGSSYQGNSYCDAVAPAEPFLLLECQFLLALDDLDSQSRTTLGYSLTHYPRLGIGSMMWSLSMALASLPLNDQVRAELTDIARKMTRLYLDEVRVGFGESEKLEQAEAALWEGAVAAANGNYTFALMRYSSAAFIPNY